MKRYRVARWETMGMNTYETYGRTYRHLSMARLACWFYGFVPDLHGYWNAHAKEVTP